MAVQNDNDLDKLYKVVSDKFDIGDFDTFKSKMTTPEDRKKFYDVVGSKGFDLGDYSQYEERLGKYSEGLQGSEDTSKTYGVQSSNSQEPSFSEVDVLEAGNVLQNQATEEDIKLSEQGLRRVLVDVPTIQGSGLNRKGEFVIPEYAVGGEPKLVEVNGENGTKGFALTYVDDKGVEQIVAERFPETTKDKGYWNDIGNSIMSGVSKANSDLASTFEYIYELGATPQNLLADVTGQDWLRANYEDVARGELNPLKLLSTYSKDQRNLSEDYAKQVTQFEKGIGESLTSGSYLDAGRQISTSIAQSAPSMLMMLLTSGVGQSANLGSIGKTALNALPFASGAFQEMKDDSTIPESVKVVASLGKGLSEVIFEQSFGTLPVAQAIVNKTLSREGLTDIVKGYFKDALSKQGVPMALVNGAVSEMATELSNNLIDIHATGTKKEVDWKGIIDAGIVGSVMDGSLTSINSIIPDKSKRARANEIESQIESLKKDIDNTTSDVQSSILEATLTKKVQELDTIVEEAKQLPLTKEQKDTLNSIEVREQEVNSMLESENIQEETKLVLEEELKSIEQERELILNPNDKENQQGVSSEVREGQELIEIESNEGTSQEKTEPSGILQTQEEITENGNTETQDISDSITVEQVSSPSLLKESFVGIVFNEEKRTNRLTELREKLKVNSNLGIASDPKKEAERLLDLTEFAVLSIADGTIKTAKAFAKALGVSETDPLVTKAFSDAQTITNELNKFKVPASGKTIKGTISESTKGGISGKTSITNKQALSSQIATLNRGAKDMVKNVQELSQTINAYIGANKDKLKGAKVPASVINTIAKGVSGVTNEKQLNRALDIVERVINDAEFRGKLAQIGTNQKAVRRATNGKNVPKDLQNVANEFSRINLNDLDADQLDRYLDMLESVAKVGFKGNKVSQSDMQSMIDLANSNNEVRKAERELELSAKKETDEYKEEKIKRLEKSLKDKGLDDSDLKVIQDESISLEERLTKLEDLSKELTVTKEQQLRENADRGLTEIKENFDSITEGLTPREKSHIKNLVDTLDVSSLPKAYLKGLNFVLDNVINNKSIVGVGRFEAIGKFQQKISDPTVLREVLSYLRTPTKMENGLMKYATSGSQDLNAIADGVRTNSYDIIEGYGGYASYENNALTANNKFKEVVKVQQEFFKKYGKSDFAKRANWQKVDLYAVANQVGYEVALQRVLNGLKSMEDMLLHSSGLQEEHGGYQEQIRDLLKELIDYRLNPATGEYEITKVKKDMSQLYSSLPEGLKAFYEYARKWSDEHQKDYFTEIGAYENSVPDLVPNYLPISHYEYATTEAQRKSEKQAGSGESLRGASSSSYKERTIQGTGNPQGKVLALGNMLINFGAHAGDILYDTYTLGDRKYGAIALDWRRNGLTDITQGEIDLSSLDRLKQVYTEKDTKERQIYGAQNSNDIDVLKTVGRILSNFGMIQSLSSISAGVKQTVPILVNTIGTLKNKGNLFTALNLLMRKNPQVDELLKNYANTARRDIISSYGNFGKGNFLEVDDANKAEKILKDTLREVDLYVGETGILKKYLGAILTNSDLFASKVSWLASYLDKTQDNNKVASFTNPDLEAVYYSNRMTSTINGESDPSVTAKLNNQQWIKLMFPFMSFALNARADLFMNVGRLYKSNTREAKMEATRNILSNLANQVVFHAVTEGVTRGTLYGASSLAQALVENMGDEDDDKLKGMLEYIAKESDALSNRAYLQRLQYLVTDLIFGGVATDLVQPLVGVGLEEFVYNPLLGKDFVKESGYKPTQNRISPLEGTPLEAGWNQFTTVGGTTAIGIEKLIANGIKVAQALDATDFESYKKGRYGKVGAEGQVYTEDMYNNPDEYGAPEWYQGAYALSALVGVTSTVLASDQLLNSITQRTTSLIKKLHNEKVGAIKTDKQLEQEINKVKDFSEIKGVKLEPEEGLELYNNYLEEVGKLYEEKTWESLKHKRTREEYEKLIRERAKKRVEKDFLKGQKGRVKEAREAEKEQSKVEKDLRKLIIENNK